MLTPPRRNPYALPIVFMVFGIGMALIYGDGLRKLPVYTEKQINESVEANLMVDLARRGRDNLPSSEEMLRMREEVRAEVLEDINGQRKKMEQGMGFGLLFLVFGAGQMLFKYLLKRTGVTKQDPSGGTS